MTYIQINNINEGDLIDQDEILSTFDATDCRYVEIIDGDYSKVREVDFNEILTKEEIVIGDYVNEVCVSKDTQDDVSFFRKSGWLERKGYWGSDLIFSRDE